LVFNPLKFEGPNDEVAFSFFGGLRKEVGEDENGMLENGRGVWKLRELDAQI
jgi:hypothetical protein